MASRKKYQRNLKVVQRGTWQIRIDWCPEREAKWSFKEEGLSIRADAKKCLPSEMMTEKCLLTFSNTKIMIWVFQQELSCSRDKTKEKRFGIQKSPSRGWTENGRKDMVLTRQGCWSGNSRGFKGYNIFTCFWKYSINNGSNFWRDSQDGIWITGKRINLWGETVISNLIGMKEEGIGLDFSIISGYEGRKLTHLLI